MSKEFDEFLNNVNEQKEPKQYPIGGYDPVYGITKFLIEQMKNWMR